MLHVKPRELAGWVAQADAAGLEVKAPPRKKRPKRTPAQLRTDLLRAIDLAPSDLGRRWLTTALARLDAGD